jgi:hypothetical protein
MILQPSMEALARVEPESGYVYVGMAPALWQ